MNRREQPVMAASGSALPVTVSRTFLALGGEPPELPGVSFDYRQGAPCDGVMLLGPVEHAKLGGILENLLDPAVPIADFGGNHGIRRDYVGMDLAESFQHVLTTFAPIWRHLEEFPYHPDISAREEFTVLRLAWSRDSPITASYDAASSHLVEYLFLGKMPGIRRRLEMMARLDLLDRTHFARTHACGKCGSSRLNAYETCPGCGGSELKEESLVHHYRCGCQEPESHFTDGHLLVCPKCRRTLKHFGVDYGKPGQVAICAGCGAANTEPPVAFACLDCSAVTPAGEAVETDWYHYRLTEDGIRALREGQLPRFDIRPILMAQRQARSPREFRLLASHELNVSKRSKRPFSAARISLLNTEEVLRECGPVATEAGFRRVVAAVLESVRAGDFIGIDDRISALIGFPDTAAKNVEITIDRIRETVRSNASGKIALGVEIAEGEAVLELLSRSMR